jgi:serine protease Do
MAININSKFSKIMSLSAAAVIVAALLYIGVYEVPSHTVNAAPQQIQPVTRTAPTAVRDSYADVAQRVAPAVVTIRSAKRVRAPQQFPFSEDPFFQQFFGNPNQNRSREQSSVLERALGSGVIVNEDGHILTNHHVVDGAEQISVELNDRRSLSAKVVGSDAPSDLALLKIQATNLPVLPLGDSDKVRVGDVCLAVGNPLGIGETVTAGIISARGRATGLSDGSFEDFLQTDAAINRGNSGGALVNTRSELIGINSQIVSPSGGNIGIGFAIPSNMARNVMSQIKTGGRVHRGKLGVGIQEINSDLANSLGLHEVRGVLVNSVEAGGPAEHAGIHPGDVITAVNGTRVDDANALRNLIASTAPGTEIALTILRNGKEQQVHARLTELPVEKEPGASSGGSPARGELLGITVQPLTPEIASQLKLQRGAQGVVVTDVDPAGPAAEAGIQRDDVILEVNHQPVKSAGELSAAVRNSGSRPALLLVSREGRNVFLAVKPAQK